jgi:nitrogen fixation NifU-like protein
MIHYNPLLTPYLGRPEFAGSPAGAPVGDAVNPVCRDRVRLAVKLGADRVIVECRFEATGCPPTLAAAARLCERVRGLSTAEATAITPDSLADDLGGVPGGKRHAFEVALEALRAAIAAVSA